MDIREKLVELIREGATEYIHPNLVDEIADHLLANGVTVQDEVDYNRHVNLPREEGNR